MKVTAQARRSGGWWAIAVPEVDGVFTQARRLDQVPEQVADAVATMLDIDAADVEVVVEAETVADDVVARARAARAAAEAANGEAAAAMREAAAALIAQDFTVRDAGVLLGVSPQRVSQLVAAG